MHKMPPHSEKSIVLFSFFVFICSSQTRLSQQRIFLFFDINYYFCKQHFVSFSVLFLSLRDITHIIKQYKHSKLKQIHRVFVFLIFNNENSDMQSCFS